MADAAEFRRTIREAADRAKWLEDARSGALARKIEYMEAEIAQLQEKVRLAELSASYSADVAALAIEDMKKAEDRLSKLNGRLT